MIGRRGRLRLSYDSMQIGEKTVLEKNGRPRSSMQRLIHETAKQAGIKVRSRQDGATYIIERIG
jgi:hypothetical protein